METKILFLQKIARNFLSRLEKLPKINKDFGYKNISVFEVSERKENDKTNKTREKILELVMNDKIPVKYFLMSSRWKNLKTETEKFLEIILNGKKIVSCVSKGGRNKNFDFLINETLKIEFKFNAEKIESTPQFSSPMNIDKYTSISYPKFFYENYLSKLMVKIPTEKVYLAEINKTSPSCLKTLQKNYYRGSSGSSQYTGEEKDIEFYNLCNKISQESITEFIKIADLKIKELTEYFTETQTGKIYMFYKNGKIISEFSNPDDYVIEKYEKNPEKSHYTAFCKSGRKLKILLRWKNGNGIAFPAFQISLLKNHR